SRRFVVLVPAPPRLSHHPFELTSLLIGQSSRIFGENDGQVITVYDDEAAGSLLVEKNHDGRFALLGGLLFGPIVKGPHGGPVAELGLDVERLMRRVRAGQIIAAGRTGADLPATAKQGGGAAFT